MRIGIIDAGPIGGSVAEPRVFHGDAVAVGFIVIPGPSSPLPSH
jgi:hypothetical protein